MANRLSRHITWENFRQMMEAGVPAIHRIQGLPNIDLFYEPTENRIGLRTSWPEGVQEISFPLKEVEILKVKLTTECLLEARVSDPSLFQEFFAFALRVADKMHLEGLDVVEALVQTVAAWRQFLRQEVRLSDEAVRGLFGELWFLDRLIHVQGAVSVESWVGPLMEPHDFRLARHEFEVKTTIGPQRHHQISSAQQLVPSLGHSLYVVSILLEPVGAGSGASLPALVSRIRTVLQGSDRYLGLFNERLGKGAGYLDDHEGYYQDSWSLRAPAMIVHINEKVPAITVKKLAGMFRNSGNRILRLEYVLDLEGLGHADGSSEFEGLLKDRKK